MPYSATFHHGGFATRRWWQHLIGLCFLSVLWKCRANFNSLRLSDCDQDSSGSCWVSATPTAYPQAIKLSLRGVLQSITHRAWECAFWQQPPKLPMPSGCHSSLDGWWTKNCSGTLGFFYHAMPHAPWIPFRLNFWTKWISWFGADPQIQENQPNMRAKFQFPIQFSQFLHFSFCYFQNPHSNSLSLTLTLTHPHSHSLDWLTSWSYSLPFLLS